MHSFHKTQQREIAIGSDDDEDGRIEPRRRSTVPVKEAHTHEKGEGIIIIVFDKGSATEPIIDHGGTSKALGEQQE